MLDIDILTAQGQIIADASAIIYMHKLDVIHAYCRYKSVITTQLIVNEICRHRENQEITTYKELITDNQLNICIPLAATNEYPRSLSDADISLLQVSCCEDNQVILTDDGALCAYCRRNRIAYINTPIALYSLAYGGRISINEFYQKYALLKKLGRYDKKVIDYMEGIIELRNNNV